MSLRNTLRYLTIVFVAELAFEHRVIAFTLHRSDITRAPVDIITSQRHPADLTAAATLHDTVVSKDTAVLDISTDATGTNPIETTAKTEEIQKNSSKDTTEGLTSDSTTNQDTTNEGTSEIASSTDEDTQPSTEQSENTRKESGKSVRETHEPELNKTHAPELNKTKTEADSTSYPPETVKDELKNQTHNEESHKNLESTIVGESTTSDGESTTNDGQANSTDSSDVTQDTTGSTEDNGITSMPFWKKYTSIDRKRLNEDALTTEKDEHLVRAAQSHISLEKAFSISSDIPSLEKLKNELLSLTSKIPTKSTELSTPMTVGITSTPMTVGITTQITTPTVVPTHKLEENTQTSSEKPRIDTINTMRAGFLDNSARTVTNSARTVTDSARTVTDSASTVTDSARTVPETTSTTTEKVQTTTEDVIETTVTTTLMAESTTQDVTENVMDKKISDATSLSQMAEDAMNEELMKENYLIEHSVKESNDNSSKGLIEGGGDFSSSVETSSEDHLSVKPISAEKMKTTVMYTVNPNYKPMKKIEVQPPKTFVRDPDDNSWRNESLSSLGIVFKANNSSKPFTQVLKNKTETELNSLLDKYNHTNEKELRERLEKMSEKRKSKRKKVDKNGDVTYVDYEEGTSGETTTKNQFPLIPPLHEVSPPTTRQSLFSLNSSAFDLELAKIKQPNATRNKKIIESFGNGDDDDEDYISLPEIDIKKFMTPSSSGNKNHGNKNQGNRNQGIKNKYTPPPMLLTSAPTTVARFPERKATVQYFPPLQKQKPNIKVNVNDYDDSFRNKIDSFTVKETTKNIPTPFTTYAPSTSHFGQRISTTGTTQIPRKTDLDKNVYHTNAQPDDNGYNNGAYVIKHLKDFLDDVVKAEEDVSGYPPPATPPTLPPTTTRTSGDYFDYDAVFRKNIIDRFVENLNAQNERFRVDFPVVYNTSVVHSQIPDSGKVQASSSAFMRRLYDDARAAKASLYQTKYDPNCDRTVELSPAYELHYYVPEDEEKQEPAAEPKAATPWRYRT